MKITWLGHSCFSLESGGFTVVTDPYEDGSVPGLMPVRAEADMVFCSHEHFDHSAKNLVSLRQNASSSCFSFKFIDSFHGMPGTDKGSIPNRIMIADDGDIRLCHFGDIGCHPTAEQTELLKNLDVALIPVGGFYTLPPKDTAELLKEISPKYIIPMHYRDDRAGFGFDVIAELSDFLTHMPPAEFTAGDSVEITSSCPLKPGIIVLRPKLAAMAP